MVSLKVIFWAIIFVITNGAVFTDYFKENKFLSALAGLFALISSIYFFEAIGKDIVDISGYKFVLYTILSIVVVFVIIHILKEQDRRTNHIKKETIETLKYKPIPKYQEGTEQERIREEVDKWNQAKKEDTKVAYKKYLEDYKYGLYSSIAEDLIALKSRWCWREEEFILYAKVILYWIIAPITFVMGAIATGDELRYYSLAIQIPLSIFGGLVVGFLWPIFFLISMSYYFFGDSHILREDAAIFSIVVFTLLFIILAVLCPFGQGKTIERIEEKEKIITGSHFSNKNVYKS